MSKFVPKTHFSALGYLLHRLYQKHRLLATNFDNIFKKYLYLLYK